MNMNCNDSVLPSAAAAIAQTPIVQLSRLTEDLKLEGNLYLKLDYLNPGFSKKDRIARQIMEDAENLRLLTPGFNSRRVIVENNLL